MLYAMFAMVLLTFGVAFRMMFLRIKAIKTGQVRISQFRLNTGEMPTEIAQAARNYSNLFEIPLLFYIAGTIAIAMHVESTSMVVCAWLFVLCRLVHSWIHLTYNNVIHRMWAFVASNACILIIWGLLLLKHSLDWV
ncbi:MAPEG family protein [Cellvibrio mixtus]|uniref:MAPEG family protein n=1 Tax=Cellvibrio mixtus TaxID=39650 RepID=UPI000586EFE0|nr:MAPEG family protein [Cellvibrio mixtus]